MRFMPDSAVLGTIGHAKRRAAKRKARARKGSGQVRRGQVRRPMTGKDLLGGLTLMFVFILVLSLFA